MILFVGSAPVGRAEAVPVDQVGGAGRTAQQRHRRHRNCHCRRRCRCQQALRHTRRVRAHVIEHLRCAAAAGLTARPMELAGMRKHNEMICSCGNPYSCGSWLSGQHGRASSQPGMQTYQYVTYIVKWEWMVYLLFKLYQQPNQFVFWGWAHQAQLQGLLAQRKRALPQRCQAALLVCVPHAPLPAHMQLCQQCAMQCRCMSICRSSSHAALVCLKLLLYSVCEDGFEPHDCQNRGCCPVSRLPEECWHIATSPPDRGSLCSHMGQNPVFAFVLFLARE